MNTTESLLRSWTGVKDTYTDFSVAMQELSKASQSEDDWAAGALNDVGCSVGQMKFLMEEVVLYILRTLR